MNGSLSATPKRRSDVLWTHVDRECVLLDRRAGAVHVLNPTAGLLWERCDGEAAVGDLIFALGEKFDIDPATATVDVIEAIKRLSDLGLVEVDDQVGLAAEREF